MYRRYYSYNDMPQIVNKCDKKEDNVHNKEDKKEDCKNECREVKKCENGKLLGRFELDDVILGVIILAILLDDGDDGLLLLALAFVFLAGLN